jgi:hypothetical protein
MMNTGETGKILCSHCKAIVDFNLYTMQHPDGRELTEMVPVNQDAEYVCEVCLEKLRKTDPKRLGTMHVTQFIAMLKVRELTEIMVQAHDLILRGMRNTAALEGEEADTWITDAVEWEKRYEKYRGSVREETPDE